MERMRKMQDAKIKRFLIALFTAIMVGTASYPAYALENCMKERLDINDALQCGDIYEREISDEIDVKEVVTDIHEDGTFETQSITEALNRSNMYSRIEFKTENLDCFTIYLRNGLEGEGIDCIEKLSYGDVIQAYIEKGGGVEQTTLEIFVAIDDEGNIMTEHINTINFE